MHSSALSSKPEAPHLRPGAPSPWDRPSRRRAHLGHIHLDGRVVLGADDAVAGGAGGRAR